MLSNTILILITSSLRYIHLNLLERYTEDNFHIQVVSIYHQFLRYLFCYQMKIIQEQMGVRAVSAMSAGAELGDHIIDSLGLGKPLARAASE